MNLLKLKIISVTNVVPLIILLFQFNAAAQNDSSKNQVLEFHNPYGHIIFANNPDSILRFTGLIYPSAFNVNISGGCAQVFGLGLNYEPFRLLDIYSEGFYQYPWELLPPDDSRGNSVKNESWHQFRAGATIYLFSKLFQADEKIKFNLTQKRTRLVNLIMRRRLKIGIEGNYTDYNAILAGGKTIFGTRTSFTGYNIADPFKRKLTFSDGFTTGFSMDYLYGGLVISQVHQYKVQFEDSMTGLKKNFFQLKLYGGLVYAPYIHYNDINVKSAEPGYSPGVYNINTYSGKSNMGFKIGYEMSDYYNLNSTSFEAGYLPGPSKSGFYFLIKGAYVWPF